MATKPRMLILTALVVLGVGGLTGCSGTSQQTEPASDVPEATSTKEAEPTPESTPTETPEVEPTETPEADTPDGGLPPDFPDPAALVGQVAHDEMAPDGTWHTVVGGTALPLVTTLGACFDGGSGDICGYSVSASVPGTSSTPQPATAALVLLLRTSGALGDGTPTWTVLDAVVTTPPGGAPSYVEACDGADGVVIWAEPGAAAGDTIPALAAVGPDASVTSLVDLDPASLSCPWMGD